MRKRIDAVSPRIGPVVLGKTLFKNGCWIFRVGGYRLPIEQQGKGTVWENTVVFEFELLRLNETLLLAHGRISAKYNATEVVLGLGNSEIVSSDLIGRNPTFGRARPPGAPDETDDAAVRPYHL
jgi:hypothetical protein